MVETACYYLQNDSEIKDHITFASHLALAAHCVVGEKSYLVTIRQ